MENKRLLFSTLIGFVIIAMMNSCGKTAEKPLKTSGEDAFHLTDTANAIWENPKITEFKAFIEQLDSSDITTVAKATEKYKAIFTGQPALLCDSAFVVFQTLYDSLEMHLSIKHQSDTTNYEPLLYEDQTAVPKALKDYRKNLTLNGFKLSASDGVTYIEQDRNFIAKNFYTLVSPVMKDYLSEIQLENKQGFAMDGVITISPRLLVDRNVWYEKFIAANPGFVFISTCKDYQKAYLTYLLCGYEKTSLYSNRQTGDLSDFYVNAYNYLMAKYADSQTAKNVLPYYDALKQKQAAAAQTILKNYHIKGMIYSLK
ncbi:MAG: hypothetical protein PHR83_12035 [Paludibacter sp.]|nr:hypothetical protein [Paludibacter sp.]